MIRSTGRRSASRRTLGDRARRSHRHTSRPPARSAGGRRARHGPGLPAALRGTRRLSRAGSAVVRPRDRRRRVRDLVGGRDGAARHLRRPRDRDPRADRGASRSTRSTSCSRPRAGTSYQLDPTCPSPLGTRAGVAVRPGARQHDGREPAADRHRMVDGGLHRVVPAPAGRSSCRRVAGRGSGLTRDHSIELGFLWVATLYSLTLPLKASITLIDSVILVGLFAAYTWRVSRAPAEEPHLVGPARYLGTFPVVTAARG